MFVLDSGVRATHQEFKPNCVRWGPNYVDKKDVDEVGHGTHVAGTIAGLQFGVAKAANIIAVKIVHPPDATNQYPYTTPADIINGFKYVYDEVPKSSNPMAVSMSAHHGGTHAGIDAAVNKVIDREVHVVVSAGNDRVNCSTFSPGHLPRVICVTACNIDDEDDGTNYGPTISVYAPGSFIISADSSKDDGYWSAEGTSCAAPHVSGLVAYLLALEPEKKILPAEMKKKVQDMALKDVLQQQKMPDHTVNYLVNNGFVHPSK